MVGGVCNIQRMISLLAAKLKLLQWHWKPCNTLFQVGRHVLVEARQLDFNKLFPSPFSSLWELYWPNKIVMSFVFCIGHYSFFIIYFVLNSLFDDFFFSISSFSIWFHLILISKLMFILLIAIFYHFLISSLSILFYFILLLSNLIIVLLIIICFAFILFFIEIFFNLIPQYFIE
jgi:hypothetical protein